MEEYRQRVGFAVGTGLVPGVMGFLVIAVTTGRPALGIIVGIIVWAIVSVTFWYRSGRSQKPRR